MQKVKVIVVMLSLLLTVRVYGIEGAPTEDHGPVKMALSLDDCSVVVDRKTATKYSGFLETAYEISDKSGDVFVLQIPTDRCTRPLLMFFRDLLHWLHEKDMHKEQVSSYDASIFVDKYTHNFTLPGLTFTNTVNFANYLNLGIVLKAIAGASRLSPPTTPEEERNYNERFLAVLGMTRTAVAHEELAETSWPWVNLLVDMLYPGCLNNEIIRQALSHLIESNRNMESIILSFYMERNPTLYKNVVAKIKVDHPKFLSVKNTEIIYRKRTYDGSDGTFIFDIETGEELRAQLNLSKRPSYMLDKILADSPDGRIRAVRSRDFRQIEFRDLKAGALLSKTQPIVDLENCCQLLTTAFSPDGKLFYAVGDGGYVSNIWDVESGIMIKSFTRDDNVSFRAAFSPNSEIFIGTGGGPNANIYIFGVKPWGLQETFRISSPLSNIACSKSFFAILNDDLNSRSFINVYSYTLNVKYRFPFYLDVRDARLAFSKNGVIIAVEFLTDPMKTFNHGNYHYLAICRAHSRKVLFFLTVPYTSEWDLRFSPDNRILASRHPDCIMVYGCRSLIEALTLRAPGALSSGSSISGGGSGGGSSSTASSTPLQSCGNR